MTTKFVVEDALGGTGATTTLSRAGFGTPQAYLHAISQAITNGAAANGASFTLGSGDMTNHGSAGVSSGDALNPTVARRVGSTQRSLVKIRPTAGSSEGHATFDQTVTDGYRLTWSNTLDTDYLIHSTLIQAQNVQCGTQEHTGGAGSTQFINLTFDADLIFFFGHTTSFDDQVKFNYSYSFGAAVRGAGTTVESQFAIATATDDFVSSFNAYVLVNDNAVYTALNGALGTSTRHLVVTSFPSNQVAIRKDVSATGLWFSYLAVQLDAGLRATCGIVDAPTSTGAFSIPIGDTWTPQWYALVPSYADVLNLSRQVMSSGAGVMPWAVGDATKQRCLMAREESAQIPTNTASLVHDRAVYVQRGDGTLVYDGAFTGFGAGTINFTFTTVETARASKWPWMAVEEESAVTPIDKTGGANSAWIGGGASDPTFPQIDVKTGGASVGHVGGGAQAVTYDKTGGGTSAWIGGGASVYAPPVISVKTGGAASAWSGGGASDVFLVNGFYNALYYNPLYYNTGVQVDTKTGGAASAWAGSGMHANFYDKTGAGISPHIGAGAKEYEAMDAIKAGGAVTQWRASGAKQYERTVSGGAISTRVGGGAKLVEYIKTGGAASRWGAGGTKTSEDAKAGGAVSPWAAGGVTVYEASRTGGAVSAWVGGGIKEIPGQTIKTGGAVSAWVGAGATAYDAVRTGGAILGHAGAGTKTVTYDKTGGAASSWVGSGASSTSDEFLKAGGALTRNIGGGASIIEFIRTGGAASAWVAGGARVFEADRRGGAITAQVGSGSGFLYIQGGFVRFGVTITPGISAGKVDVNT